MILLTLSCFPRHIYVFASCVVSGESFAFGSHLLLSTLLIWILRLSLSPRWSCQMCCGTGLLATLETICGRRVSAGAGALDAVP